MAYHFRSVSQGRSLLVLDILHMSYVICHIILDLFPRSKSYWCELYGVSFQIYFQEWSLLVFVKKPVTTTFNLAAAVSGALAAFFFHNLYSSLLFGMNHTHTHTHKHNHTHTLTHTHIALQVDYKLLLKGLHQACAEMDIQPVQPFVNKVFVCFALDAVASVLLHLCCCIRWTYSPCSRSWTRCVADACDLTACASGCLQWVSLFAFSYLNVIRCLHQISR